MDSNLPSSNTDSNKQLVTLSTMTNPVVIENLFKSIQSFWPTKKKIGYSELNILIEQSSTVEDVARSISSAIIQAEEETARILWNFCAHDIKYAMIIPDRGRVNGELVKKLDIEGSVIRKAFLKQTSLSFPKKTPYSITYGDLTAENAEELALIIEELWSLDPYGRLLVQEFFQDIDLRVLYLLTVHEIDQHSIDTESRDRIYLSVKSGDQVPADLPLLGCIQHYAPETFKMLSEEITNPVWQENRAMFSETYGKLHYPHVILPDNFSVENNEDGDDTNPNIVKDRFEDSLDSYLKTNEGEGND